MATAKLSSRPLKRQKNPYSANGKYIDGISKGKHINLRGSSGFFMQSMVMRLNSCTQKPELSSSRASGIPKKDKNVQITANAKFVHKVKLKKSPANAALPICCSSCVPMDGKNKSMMIDVITELLTNGDKINLYTSKWNTLNAGILPN